MRYVKLNYKKSAVQTIAVYFSKITRQLLLSSPALVVVKETISK